MTFEEQIQELIAVDRRIQARHEALTARHEALTERHEALAQGVELNQHQIEANTQAISRLMESQAKNEVMLAQLTEDVRTLAAVSQLQDRRRNRSKDGPLAQR